MQERLELIFNLFPLSPLHSPQVDHNIKECSPWQHNPGRNVGVWVSCGRDFTLNALICTKRINMIRESHKLNSLPLHSTLSIQSSFIFLLSLSPQWQSRIKTGINLVPSHLIQLQNNAGRPLCPNFHCCPVLIHYGLTRSHWIFVWLGIF